MMEHPMTSCGCFECIVAYVPECNGVMIVNREFLGDTPVGMTFSTLAGTVGGGQQTPGFIGIGKTYIASKKFISADGGFQRVVWMPKELKSLLEVDLQQRANEMRDPDFMDKVADETIATDAKELRAFLETVNHPALTMPDMSNVVETVQKALQKELTKESETPMKNLVQTVKAEIGTQATKSLTVESLSLIKQKLFAELATNPALGVSQEVVDQISNSLVKQLMAEGLTATSELMGSLSEGTGGISFRRYGLVEKSG